MIPLPADGGRLLGDTIKARTAHRNIEWLPSLAFDRALRTAAFAPAARADPEPLAYQSFSPAEGSYVRPSPNPVTFTLTGVALPFGGEGHIEVATSNVLGADGTLADDKQVDFLSIDPLDSSSTTFRGRSEVYGPTAWTNRPGRYYAQAVIFGLDLSTPSQRYREFRSPVISLLVGTPPLPPPPPPDPLAMNDTLALSYALRLARRLSAPLAIRAISRSCQVDARNERWAVCDITWRDVRTRYAGVARFRNYKVEGRYVYARASLPANGQRPDASFVFAAFGDAPAHMQRASSGPQRQTVRR
jgi:hypothetical protein